MDDDGRSFRVRLSQPALLQRDWGARVVGSHTGSRIVWISPLLYAGCSASLQPAWAVWAVWNQGCPVLEGWKAGRAQILSLGPGVSCCYWVRCGPTMPCTARVILPSIKHQAQEPGPGAPSPKPKSRRTQAPEAERP